MWTDLLNPSTRILFAVINNRGLVGSSKAPLGALSSLREGVRLLITPEDTIHNVSQKPQSIIDA